MNYLVGLTGGIGSGKSTVADMFAAQGVRVIDTDLISRQLTQAGGQAMPAIRDAFGPLLIDGTGALERNKMRELVFANPIEKQRLESILHPLILAATRQQVAIPADAAYTLIVVPLLFENGRYADWLHRIVTVDCPEETQVLRTMQRSNMDETSVRTIMAQQFSRPERLRLADEVVHNDGSLDDLQLQVTAMHHRLCVLASESD